MIIKTFKINFMKPRTLIFYHLFFIPSIDAMTLIPFTILHRLALTVAQQYIILLIQIQMMHKNRYYKAPKPQLKSEKQLKKQKPEWTTDFSDPDKYKLSQAQMIERKAALQSKNREAARKDLEERRRKLEMGVIDEQTRKVYQTALHAKKIELNPPARKNLSQMIQIERERRNAELAKMENEEQYEEQEIEDDDIDRQIEEAKNFIKKLEKAKKQTNIQKAVDVILDEKKSSFFGAKKDEKQNQTAEQFYLQNRKEQPSHEETLTNIEQTIKFMEQKLFNRPKFSQARDQDKIKKPQNNFINSPQLDSISHRQDSYELTSFEETTQNYQLIDKYHDNKAFQKQKEVQKHNYQSVKSPRAKMGSFEEEFSGLRIHLEEPEIKEVNDEDCMSTIRRMREMIQGKEYLYEPEHQQKLVGKQNISHFSNKQDNGQSYFKDLIQNHDDDEEVDFSLTMNQDQQQELKNQIKKPSKVTIKQPQMNKGAKTANPSHFMNYEEIKRNLFQQVDHLNDFKIDTNQNYAPKTSNKKNPNKSSTLYFESQDFIDESAQLKINTKSEYLEEDSQPEIKITNKMKKKKKQKESQLSNQFKQLQSMIENNKSTIENLHMEPIGMYGSAGVMGYDYRGSINLKKNIKHFQ